MTCNCWDCSLLMSTRLIFTCWGCFGLCLLHKPIELADSFLFCSCECFCLCGPFNCISFHKFSRQLLNFSVFSSSFISAKFVLSTKYLFMKISFSSDIILCGWLGLKHRLINYPLQCPTYSLVRVEYTVHEQCSNLEFWSHVFRRAITRVKGSGPED